MLQDLLRELLGLGSLQEAFPHAAPQRTDEFWLREHGCIDHLPALPRDESLHPCRAHFYDVALSQGTGIEVVCGHCRRASRIVCDNGGPGSSTGVKAASVPSGVRGMDARIPCASIC